MAAACGGGRRGRGGFRERVRKGVSDGERHGDRTGLAGPGPKGHALRSADDESVHDPRSHDGHVVPPFPNSYLFRKIT